MFGLSTDTCPSFRSVKYFHNIRHNVIKIFNRNVNALIVIYFNRNIYICGISDDIDDNRDNGWTNFYGTNVKRFFLNPGVDAM